jgi:hypothetical protein
MKKIYNSVLLLVCITVQLCAQHNSQDFDFADFSVPWQDFRINGHISLDVSSNQLVSLLGQPDQVLVREIFSYDVTVFVYGLNSFPYIEDYGLTMYEFNDNRFFLQIGDLSIRVGDTIDALAQRFPKIYANTWTSKLTGEKAVNIYYSFIDQETGEIGISDNYLVILRNNAGIITKIYEYGHY